MFCRNCGARAKESQTYCSACGKPLTAAPMTPGPTRIDSHLRLLAIMWIAISALRLLPGISLLAFGTFALSFVPAPLQLFLLPIATLVGVFFLASAFAGFAAGWGLLERRPWARTLALILGVIALIHVPLGTALGLYTLWVLLPSHSEQDYRRMSRAG